jgi:hypothetical protein
LIKHKKPVHQNKKEINHQQKNKTKKNIKLISSKKIILITSILKLISLKLNNYLLNILFIVLMEFIKIDSYILQPM